MVDDAKLQKVNLGPDWIDLSFGEPKVVMQALFRQLNRFGDPFKMPTLYDLPKWEYQPAAGKPDLVSLLEEKYSERVVVCNGAKQALAAAIYAFKRNGCSRLYFGKPYYPANPSIAESIAIGRSDTEVDSDCNLITSPNNPDGEYIKAVDIVSSQCRKPTIHDAAYYTEVYLPDNEITLPLGHVQIFSMSKMYGLSGLRIGYAVCHSEKYYKDMVNYMELTTAGVSAASQDIARNIELFFKENPSYYKDFVKEARNSLIAAREELKNLDPEVLVVEPCASNSMFAWCKIGPKLDNKAAKVHILEGTLFGKPGYMRMNIAHPPEIISEAVSRLNAHKIRN